MERLLTDLADANLIDSVRQHARWQHPCESAEADGVLMMAGANAAPFAYRNCAIRVDPDVPAPEALQRAQAYFGERDRRFTFILRDGRDTDLVPVLEAAGLRERSTAPCMLADTAGTEPTSRGSIHVREFDDLQLVQDAVAVNAAAFQSLGLSSGEIRNYFNKPEGLLAEAVAGFIAYLGDRPVATAMTLLSGEAAGLYWVGTLEEARGRGLGAWCTWLATRAGFERGARGDSTGKPLWGADLSPAGLPDLRPDAVVRVTATR
ncbi:GNAT family N-acetyltransferase [Ectothiorhodospiraceae bacterium WFHF3C12]|nr:GNAT family N-acetyltransferase [Ectothiorhodospiraceae bacterium WFHF3C12]